MTKSRSPHVGSVHKDSPRRMPQVRGGCYLAFASSRVLRGEPHAHRPFDAELDREGQRYRYRSRRRPTRGRSRQQPPQAPSLRIPRPADARHPTGSHLTPSRLLTFTPPAIIIVVANVSFLVSPHRRRP